MNMKVVPVCGHCWALMPSLFVLGCLSGGQAEELHLLPALHLILPDKQRNQDVQNQSSNGKRSLEASRTDWQRRADVSYSIPTDPRTPN